MKKVLFSLVCLVACLLVISCGGASTPADAAADCVELIKAQDYEALVETIDFSEVEADKVQESKDLFLALFKEKGGKEMEKKQGITSYTLVSEEIAEDGKSAVVKYDITYGDGSTQTNTFNMVLVDGEWKQSVKK